MLEFLNHSKILSPVINERDATNTYSFSRKIIRKTGTVIPSPVKDLVIKFCLNSCAKPSTHFIKFVDTKYTANGAANTTVQTGLAWAMSTNNVQAYYKIVKRTTTDTTPQGTTIEEKIDEMLSVKARLANEVVVSTGENWITEMSNGELINLFTLK